jgi:stearoyl-CoA desaturase (delta-9 desaturase)
MAGTSALGNLQAMTPLARRVNVAAVVLPFAIFVAAVALLPRTVVGWTDIAILAVLYVMTGLGVTVGFHRLLTHNAFGTRRWMRYALAIAGSMAAQGPVLHWVADHRKHHAHTDEEGDPHSPHVDHGGGWQGALRGLYHAHVGWLWREQGRAARRKYAPDLVEDAVMVRISKLFEVWVLVSLLIPFAAGWVLTGEVRGAFTALLWGGLVRIFLLHHVTWSINSICHFFGRRRFATEDHSTNVFWLAPFSFGESWHHNHHAFPRAAVQGFRWWELDTSGLLIRGLEKLGLAWNVVRITPERQAQKAVSASASSSPSRTGASVGR